MPHPLRRRALTLLLVTVTGAAAAAQAGSGSATRGGPHQAPPQSYSGQWYTTPDNCTYSRTRAPGHPVRWILVWNPHHVGKPAAHRRCPGML